MLRTGKPLRQKLDEWLPRAEGKGRGQERMIATGYWISLGGEGNVLKLAVLMAVHICEILKTTGCIVKIGELCSM